MLAVCVGYGSQCKTHCHMNGWPRESSTHRPRLRFQSSSCNLNLVIHATQNSNSENILT